MAKVIGPWTPNYPVDFKSNGDTSRAAFGKHIQEIERIYGLLSGLGASKIEAEDLTAAMTANKNEWTTAIAAEKSARESAIAAEKSARESAIAAEATARSNGDVALGRRIDGLTFGDIGGTLGMDRTTGNLPSSRVSGNFGTDRIDGLSEMINNAMPEASMGITDGSLGADGYIKFGNGLIIGWGRGSVSSSGNPFDLSNKFSNVYACACTPSMCYQYESLSGNGNSSYGEGLYEYIGILSLNNNKIQLNRIGMGGGLGPSNNLSISFSYIAVGK